MSAKGLISDSGNGEKRDFAAVRCDMSEGSSCRKRTSDSYLTGIVERRELGRLGLDHRAARRDINALRELGGTWGGAPVETIEDPVLLHRAARAIGGGPKLWGHIFSELLGGNIAYGISQDASARISIPGCDAIGLRSLELTDAGSSLEARISQRDAVEILNLPLKHANLLVADEPLSGGFRFCADRIQQLARTRITLAEMSARTGIHGT